MENVLKFLLENPSGFMATVDDQGKPKVRPFGFMMGEENRLYFCTANTKKVYQEMKAQPWVEYSTMTQDYKWIRVTGKVVFISDLETKKKVFEVHPVVRSAYKSADNPVFEVFYLEEAEATFFDMTHPPKTVKL